MSEHDPRNPSHPRPETMMLGHGYDPFLSEGSVKPPVFLTSTFVFRRAEDGKRFFELAYGLKEKDPGEVPGLIYSRINNPDLEILENRLAVWERAEKALVFASGMAAISSTVLAHLVPGEQVIATTPVYGGTHYFMSKMLPRWGMGVHWIHAGSNFCDELEASLAASEGKARLVYLETPANPVNLMTDLKRCVEICARYGTPERRVLLVVDNTFLGPVFQQPLLMGVDISLYSATKFIGGHSDVVAGAVLGREELVKPVAEMRNILGNMASPFDCWLLMRSLETVGIRMRQQQTNARAVVRMLKSHEAVRAVYYPGELDEEQDRIWREQCSGSGSLIAFDVVGGEAEAFRVLNAVKHAKLAVSLGGTESLIEHPATMTHCDMSPEDMDVAGITPSMIRLSVGIEHVDDLVFDLSQALDSLL
ncbi:MAG: cystathionine gamma-synthase family protein [Candidatus Delongbacteria bacterium]|nr:cystathionine gamma-synthase family protein [Candidatus Delongbacteria bacterium]